MKYPIRALQFGAIALLFISVLSACQTTNNRSPEIFLLPEAYVGSFYIIHSIKNGKAPRVKDGVRIYEIPSSGVLITQMDANEGWTVSDKIRFYHRQPDGEAIEIKGRWSTSFEDTVENRSETEITIFGGGIGEFQGDANSCEIIYRSYYVGTKKDVLDGVNLFQTEDAIKNRVIECGG